MSASNTPTPFATPAPAAATATSAAATKYTTINKTQATSMATLRGVKLREPGPVAQDGVTGRSEGGSASRRCRGGEVAVKETHAAHELKNGSSGAAARPLLGAQTTLT